MPIYEYECRSCHERVELLQKISDAPATKCPQCQTDALQKMVTSAAFQLKGNGWYVTDFKDKKTSEKKTSSDTSTATCTTTNKDTKKEASSQTGSSADTQ